MKRLFWLLPLFFFTACTQDFEDINTNENAPSAIQPEFLLRQVLYGYGDAISYEGFVAGNLLSQHFAMIDFNLFDRHALNSPQEGGNPWPILYTALRDNETILEIVSESPAQAVYEGPALVMKAYLAMTLTDMFGDVPYFEAFQGRASGVTNPRYDAQADIYQAAGGILDNLERAVAVMDADPGIQPLRGDILFNGNLEGWIRFANSLRLKALMRIADRVEPGADIQAIVDDGRFIDGAAWNATFDFTAGPPNSFPFATARIGIFNVFLMSATAADIFADLEDPRVGVLYRPSAANNDFAGVINGIDPTSPITPDNFARPGRIWRENTGALDFNFLTSWENDFLLAEAAMKGFVNLDARELYEEAVAEAFAYWDTALPADYLVSGPAAWTATNGLEQIITQKWIASIGNTYEGWAEWRRTGFPALRDVAASLNGGLYPVRMPYPNDEQALNFENFREAAATTDNNSINAPVWWDVN